MYLLMFRENYLDYKWESYSALIFHLPELTNKTSHCVVISNNIWVWYELISEQLSTSVRVSGRRHKQVSGGRYKQTNIGSLIHPCRHFWQPGGMEGRVCFSISREKIVHNYCVFVQIVYEKGTCKILHSPKDPCTYLLEMVRVLVKQSSQKTKIGSVKVPRTFVRSRQMFSWHQNCRVVLIILECLYKTFAGCCKNFRRTHLI